MNEILECRFMRILLRGKKHDYDPNYLLAAYTDFRSVLLGVSDGDMHYKDKFRTLKSTYEILNKLEIIIEEKDVQLECDRIIIRQAYKCPTPPEQCPVLIKRAEMDNLRKRKHSKP